MSLLPPKTTICGLSFPIDKVLLVTLNQPKKLNCLTQEGHHELDRIWQWLDANPGLVLAIITGSGRVFCAGADLQGRLHPGYFQSFTGETSSGG